MVLTIRSLLDNTSRDARFALRSLRRDAASTMFAIAIAGLGIGASTMVFSICHALLLRPLPFENPERLVWIANGTSENLSAQTVQVLNLVDLREQSTSLEDVAGFYPFYASGDIRFSGAGDPERLTGVPVTETFFPMLGVPPLLGRIFDSTESRGGASRTAVLDYQFWQRRFARDPAIVGRSIVLDGEPTTILGVMPPSFDFAATFTPGRRVDLFVPYPLSPENNRRGNTLALIGRLKPGVRLQSAQTEASIIGSRIVTGRTGPGVRRNAFAPRVSRLRERVSGRFEPALIALAGAVAFLMLLVCANLSNLLLVRASIRQREMALRAALGATRHRLIRQMLVESLLLCICGATLGVALAWGGTALVSRLQGTSIPLLSDVRVDGVVLGFTVLVAVVTGLAFGLLPALQASGLAPSTVLSEGSRGSTGGRSGWVRRTIVVAEVALVCVLLTGAGLLTRSLGRVLEVQPGFAAENVIAIRVDPRRRGTTLEQRNAYFDEVVRSVAAVPGVEGLGLTDALPLGDNFGWRRWGAETPEQPRAPQDRIQPLVRMIDDGYLGAMRISLRAGRAFTSADDATSEPVMIVNETLARMLWPGQDPIGRIVKTSGQERRVVGVVDGVRYFALDREVDAEMYMPLRQTGDYASVDLVVRGTIAAASLAAGVREALTRVDPNLPVVEFRTMQQLVDHSMLARRFIVLLVAGFAGFGLVLSALGIYAVISYSVRQRAQEFGIRMALGATPQGLGGRILGETGALVLVGLAIGLPMSWAAARGIRGLLFDVGASDPVTFVTVVGMLAVVAGMAGYLPARRAARVDPSIALTGR